MQLFQTVNPVTLEPVEHRYHDTIGNEYTSVSKVIREYKEKFDADRVSMAMSRGNPFKAKQLKEQWAEKNKIACDRGDYIHDNLESYIKTGTVRDEGDEIISMFATQIGHLLEPYESKHSEQVLHLADEKIAGTADLVLELEKTKYSKKGDIWVDIKDFKTNLDGVPNSNKYLQNLLYPLNHLIASKYNEYAIQLSLYAYMIEHTFGYKIHSLSIIYIPEDLILWHEIPVPYMYSEVKALLNHYQKNKVNVAVTV